jgi:N6-adenosine-specific RNA methylase IME4
VTNLVKYDAACKAIAEAAAVDEVKDILDQSVAMQVYARQAKNKDLEVQAWEIRHRAERRIGELMAAQKTTVGMAPAGRPKIGFQENPIPKPPTLKEAGIDKNLANRARQLAAVPEAEFEAELAEAKERLIAETERFSASILKRRQVAEEVAAAEHRTDTTDDLAAIIAAGRRYGAIYADPPWSYRVYSGAGKARSAERQYKTMTQEDICALPVAGLAADDCVLFMWAVMPQLPEALQVIQSWGFEYKTCGFTWVKTYPGKPGSFFLGMGYWTRANPEVCLLATRGKPSRKDMGVEQLLVAPVGKHSSKPEEAAERIERLVDGPYLEMFGRRPRDGWTVWGNEVEANLFHQDVQEVA